MTQGSLVTHSGRVTGVNGHTVTVRIEATSACASCQGKSFCSMSDKKEKDIIIDVVNQIFTEGEEVKVSMRLSQGMKAVVWAYIVPLCLLMIILLTLPASSLPEAVCALGALLAVAVYYLILYRMRDKLKKKYVFEIEKLK